jgi:two-component system cell cycle response regulator
MTARVLIVDDIPTNLKLLEARLAAEYFEVVTAASGPEAIEICETSNVDVVLLDVMMPGMDGFEVCQRLKRGQNTYHIPIVMVTALDQPSDRVRGLECGADDFLTKPVDDVQLLARVKSLVRLKALTDELRARAMTGQQLAIEDSARVMDGMVPDGGHILLIDEDARHARRLQEVLEATHKVDVLTSPGDAALQLAQKPYELAIVDMAMVEFDPLRVCSQLRTREQSRQLPIILVAEEGHRPQVVRGLDLGINDFIMRPVERNELLARVRTQVRRHRFTLELRERVNSTMQMAIVDELTGLYNRRYFDRHLSMMLEKSTAQDRDMAVMMLDLDYFKSVNDTHGHDAGDAVLKEFAERLQRNIRGVDLACRFGGEEFVVLMPDTDLQQAHNVAERVRSSVAERMFEIGTGAPIQVTVSVGAALNNREADTPETLLKRADIALYLAKSGGRNQVIIDAA